MNGPELENHMRRMVSVMCGTPSMMEDVINKIEQTDVEGYHIDVVDSDIDSSGNICNQLYRRLCSTHRKMKEIHLLVSISEHCISSVCGLSPDIVYVHNKAEDVISILRRLRASGIEAGVFFESDVPIDTGYVRTLLQETSRLQVLTVPQKTIGGAWLEHAVSNIQQLVKLKEDFDFEIEIDGGCSQHVITQYQEKGVNAFVLGTKSGFFDEFDVK